MSKNQNTILLESKFAYFQEALADGNVDLAKNILKNVKDEGFDTMPFQEEIAEWAAQN